MKNQVHRIAALLAGALLSSSAMAAADAHLIDNGPSQDGGASVAYSTCDDPEEECIVAQFGCSTATGWVELFDGKEIAKRLLEADSPAMTFHVGNDRFESRAWHFESGVNELNWGWIVKIEGGDMAEVFSAITKQPDATVTVDIAGQQAYDFTPAKADRPALSKMADMCLRAMAAGALDTVEPASLGL